MINFLDVQRVRNAVPAMIVHAKIGSFAIGIERCLSNNRSVRKTHGKKVFHALVPVRDGIDHSRTVNFLVPVIIADNVQDILDCDVGDETRTKPVVDQSGWNFSGNVRAGGSI